MRLPCNFHLLRQCSWQALFRSALFLGFDSHFPGPTVQSLQRALLSCLQPLHWVYYGFAFGRLLPLSSFRRRCLIQSFGSCTDPSIFYLYVPRICFCCWSILPCSRRSSFYANGLPSLLFCVFSCGLQLHFGSIRCCHAFHGTSCIAFCCSFF